MSRNKVCDAARRSMADLGSAREPADALAAHLATCAACRGAWADQAFARRALAAADWPPAPATASASWSPEPRSANAPGLPEPRSASAPWSREPSRDGGSRADGRETYPARRPTRPPTRPGRWQRLGDWALLGAAALVLVLILARGRLDLPPREGALPSTPAIGVPATATRPAPQLPAWAVGGEPGQVRVLTPGSGPFLIGHDLYIDQVLDFTLSPLWTGADEALCEAIWLDWDDGQGEALACPPAGSSPPAELSRGRFPLTHRYHQPGAYRPRILMRQAGGALLQVPVADFLVRDRHVSLAPDPAAGQWPGIETGRERDIALLLLLGGAGLLLLVGRVGRSARWSDPDRMGGGRGARGAGRILRGPARIPAWILGFLMLAALAGLVLSSWTIRPEQVEPILGRYGLDPLRPDAALVGATLRRRALSGHGRIALRFADGGTGMAEPPIVQGGRDLRTPFGDIVPRHEDGLGRLRTTHEALDLPFAEPARDGIGLGTPRALPRDGSAEAALVFDEAWFRAACLTEGNLIPSPDERAALLARRVGDALSIARLDLATGAMASTRPRLHNAAWSPDGRWVVGGSAESAPAEGSGGERVRLELRDGRSLALATALYIEAGSGFAAAEDGIWLARPDGAWRVPWPAGDSPAAIEARRVFAWPAAEDYRPSADRRWIAPAPGGDGMAYGCLAGTCLVDAAGQPRAALADAFVNAAADHAIWHPQGRWLARLEVAEPLRTRQGYPWLDEDGPGSRLRLVDSDGKLIHQLQVASGGATSPPRWSADGRWLLLTACPRDGRRIVAVDAERGHAVDLSQAGWDAWAALLPQSGALLLHNGRGGLWTAPLRLNPVEDPGT